MNSTKLALQKQMAEISFWVSPWDDPQSMSEVIQRIRNWTPRRAHANVLWPAVYRNAWQRNCKRSLPDELAPKDAEHLVQLRAEVEGEGIGFGAWVVPGECSQEEAKMHAAAGKAAGFLALDVEPYEGFLVKPYNRNPIDYLAVLNQSLDGIPLALSIVPQKSGIQPLGLALTAWCSFADSLRPQCYHTDNPALSIAYSDMYLRSLGIPLPPIIPIVPHPLTEAERFGIRPKAGRSWRRMRSGRDAEVWRAL
jgi:hypothetical protein